MTVAVIDVVLLKNMVVGVVLSETAKGAGGGVWVEAARSAATRG